MRDLTVMETESATFKCEINKIPKDATITWYLNDKVIDKAKDSRVTLSADGKRLACTIDDTTLDDEGKIRVKIGNSVSEAKLKVEGKKNGNIFWVISNLWDLLLLLLLLGAPFTHDNLTH